MMTAVESLSSRNAVMVRALYKGRKTASPKRMTMYVAQLS